MGLVGEPGGVGGVGEGQAVQDESAGLGQPQPAQVVAHRAAVPTAEDAGEIDGVHLHRAGKAERIDADLTESVSFIKAAITKMDGLINAILGARYSSQLTKAVGYISASKLAEAGLTTEERRTFGYGIFDGSVKHYLLKFPTNMNMWIEAWSRVKSA